MTDNLTYFARQKENWKYQIFGREDNFLILDDYETKIDKDNFLLWVEQYYWKDIEWYLKLIEENFVLLWKDWTDKITETKLGFKIKQDLDELELQAFIKWRIFLDDIDFEKQKIDLDFVLELHRFMLNDLYIWAWELRKIDVKFWNLEWIQPNKIRENLILLFEDINFRLKNWKDNKQELASILANFEYRFICIHPFINTNGRFARLLVNAYLISLWFENVILEYSTLENREKYLGSIRRYDDWNYAELETLIFNLIKWL
jgi:cell filamentation protein